jgi:hypothetical protein
VATSKSRGRRARFRLRTIAKGWPWYYESAPVRKDEILLRAIPNAPGYFSEEMGNWKVNLDTFRPRKRDTDGLSFFREDFTTPQELAEKNQYASGIRVARITVRQLQELGLTAKPCPDEGQAAGHTVVPEMRYVEGNPGSREQRRRIKDIAQRLAQFATSNGIYSPPSLNPTVSVKKKR